MNGDIHATNNQSAKMKEYKAVAALKNLNYIADRIEINYNKLDSKSAGFLKDNITYTLNKITNIAGVDPNVNGPALAYAVKIIMDACGGEIVNVCTAGRSEFTPNRIAYNPSFCLQRTGVDMPIDTQRKILESLQFNVNDGKGGIWTITPRSARVDMTTPENVVSDLIRIYGYDKVGLSGVVETINENADKMENKSCMTIKHRLANLGLNENISFNLTLVCCPK